MQAKLVANGLVELLRCHFLLVVAQCPALYRSANRTFIDQGILNTSLVGRTLVNAVGFQLLSSGCTVQTVNLKMVQLLCLANRDAFTIQTVNLKMSRCSLANRDDTSISCELSEVLFERIDVQATWLMTSKSE